MNMKQMKAAAPDLLGTPSYYPDGNHHQTIIGQLKEVGMMPVAWAMEEQAERITDLEEDLDKRLDPEEQAELADTLDRSVDALTAMGNRLNNRRAEVKRLMDAHEDDADTTLYFALANVWECLGQDRSDLDELAEEVAGVKAQLED